MNPTKLLVLGVVRLFEPVHGYQVRGELLSWRVENWANLNPLDRARSPVAITVIVSRVSPLAGASGTAIRWCDLLAVASPLSHNPAGMNTNAGKLDRIRAPGAELVVVEGDIENARAEASVVVDCPARSCSTAMW